ncbi:MAG: beta-galactosidase [Spirochaetales bacterium]|nr:beta-galactosidase [Spirochaetales bacterium]
MSTFFYGGDYNPDQWSDEIVDLDLELFKKANINIVTLPVFSWAKFQSSDTEYHFEWFDKIINKITASGLNICMATSTAVQPAWMSHKYPEILPVDFEGRKRAFGGRVKFCPNSEIYREFASKLVTKLVERYGNNKNIKLWHVGNEYDNWCYCPKCQSEFRNWLKEKYSTLDELNRVWYTSFWGHTFYSWDEIVAPSGLSEMWNDNGRVRTNFQSISLDYARFMSDSILDCYKLEYKIIKDRFPQIPVTTNFMGFFKPLNYFKWAEFIDVISWDSYPGVGEPYFLTSMRHDLMRSLKKDRPFLLMEQTPSQTNWAPYNSCKRPGDLKLQSFQAIAHGSDSVMFFQLRRSVGACEKLHSGVIDHVGHGETRVFRECTELGDVLNKLGSQITGSIMENKTAIIFDWENWWALEYSSGPSTELFYLNEIEKYYNALHKTGAGIDFVTPDSDLSQYSLVVAPCLYLISNRNGRNIETYVKNGGKFVTSFMSGVVNETDLAYLGGYPGPLSNVLGIWVEEFDSLPKGKFNTGIPTSSFLDREYKCEMVFDIIHTLNAQSLAIYGNDYYKDLPVITKNIFGSGDAYYIGSSFEQDGIDSIIRKLSPGSDLNIEVFGNVETTLRKNSMDKLLFLLNHDECKNKIDLKNNQFQNLQTLEKHSGQLELNAKDVMVLRLLNE